LAARDAEFQQKLAPTRNEAQKTAAEALLPMETMRRDIASDEDPFNDENDEDNEEEDDHATNAAPKPCCARRRR
jgi:hypothetical protein